VDDVQVGVAAIATRGWPERRPSLVSRSIPNALPGDLRPNPPPLSRGLASAPDEDGAGGQDSRLDERTPYAV